MKPLQAKDLRILLLLALLAGLFALGRATGITGHLRPERVRDLVQRAGPWGHVAYLGVFAVGELLHIPGMLFVAAGVLAFGKVEGFFSAFAGAMLSVTVSFLFVRAVAGRVITDAKRPFVRRVLAELGEHPVRTVALLRVFLWLAPSVNYALAMSSVRLRDYLVGSAMGLLLPVLGATLFLEWLFVRYAWLFH